MPNLNFKIKKIDYNNKNIKDQVIFIKVESFEIKGKLVEPQELDFDYDLYIENEIKNSSEKFDKTVIF